MMLEVLNSSYFAIRVVNFNMVVEVNDINSNNKIIIDLNLDNHLNKDIINIKHHHHINIHVMISSNYLLMV